MADTTSHNRMRDFQTKASLRWDSVRPYATALVIGLIAGPILTMALGLQVLESTADKRSDQAAVAIQAQICAAQARTAEPMAADLNWQSRAELAERWAVMPGSSQAAPGVASACSNILAARA
jgi:hypothetical protein